MSEDSNSTDSVELDPADISDISFEGNVPIIEDGKPRLEITEQPQTRGFRFRYKCEGPSHGGLQGVHSERGSKKYPTVAIKNYVGNALIVVSLVTEDEPKPHAHELIGKNCKNGICTVNLTGTDMSYSFQNLGIQHVTKRKVVDILTERILADSVSFLNNNKSFTNEQRKRAKEEAQEQAKNMQLNVVRLKFQAYITDPPAGPQQLPPVYSHTIFDSKSPGTAALKICRMDKHAGCCEGNDEVFLLCDKVQKDDISVRFFETDEDGAERWESYGTFGPSDVHRQYAIVFKTPAYHDMNISQPKNVQVQLKRVSDGASSDPKPFTYYPKQHDRDDVEKKRKKPLPGFGGGTIGGKGDSGGGNFTNGTFGGFGGGLENIGPFGGQSNNVEGNQQKFSLDLSTLLALNNLTTSYKRPLKRAKRNRYRRRPIPDTDSTDSSDSCEYSTGDSATFDLDPGLEGDQSSMDETDGVAQCQPSFTAQMMKHLTFPSHQDRVVPSAFEHEMNLLNASKCSEARCSAVPEEQMWSGSPDSFVTMEKYTNLMKKLNKLKKQLETYEEGDRAEQSLLYCVGMSMARALQSYAMTGNPAFLLATHRRLVADTDNAGDTTLHLAVLHGQLSVLKMLLKLVEPLADASIINSQNNQGQTAVHLAVLTQQPQAVGMLLCHGADVNTQDLHGNSLLHLSVQDADPLHLHTLLQEAHQHNHVLHLDTLNYNGVSALHMAVMAGSVAHVQLLVKAGADPDIKDGKTGYTPLHIAVKLNNTTIATYLVFEAEADVNAGSFDGNTALHLAVSQNSEAMAAMLVSAGADPDAENLDDSWDSETEDRLDGARWGDHARMGVTPRDLAFNNPKMLEVLDGKCSMTDGLGLQHIIGDMSANCDPGLPDDAYYQLPGFTCSGDMEKLGRKLRGQLARLLDPAKPGADWVALSEWLNMGGLVSTLRVTASPTLSLLQQLQLEGGTVQMLEECLVQMRRDDAVSILRSLRTSCSSKPSINTDAEKYDSGFGSVGSELLSDMASLQCR